MSERRRYVYRRAMVGAIARAADGLGDSFFGRSSWRARRPLPPIVRRILIVKLDALGDFVTALPAIEALARAYPRAEIDALVAPEVAPLLALAPIAFARVETLAPRWLSRGGVRAGEIARAAARLLARRADIAVELRGDPIATLLARAGSRFCAGIGHAGLGFLLDREHAGWRSGHQAEMLAEVAALAGAKSAGAPRPRLSVSREIDERARAHLGPLDAPVIAFHLGAGDPRKVWPPERHAAVAAALARGGAARIALVGGPGDRALAERFLASSAGLPVIDLAGKIPVVETCGVLARCAALVATDSGPAHLAAALGTPVVIAFSPVNDPARWRPLGNRVEVVVPAAGESIEALDSGRVVEAVRRVVR